MESSIRIERVCHQRPRRGSTVLVDLVWPRGIKKEDLGTSPWLREIGLSDELRKWFGHRPDRWEELHRRYRAELNHPK